MIISNPKQSTPTPDWTANNTIDISKAFFENNLPLFSSQNNSKQRATTQYCAQYDGSAKIEEKRPPKFVF